MHVELDKVWRELGRVLKPGAFACINIGDATRTLAGRFRLYSNHSRIMAAFRNEGFDCLPVILWRKQTNAPNKFMGSGMLPSGAYVTLEHEYILIFQKGRKKGVPHGRREVGEDEERLLLGGEEQVVLRRLGLQGHGAQRLTTGNCGAGAVPIRLELPYRLINMYSLHGDTILDPFLGTGTTSLAALACGRNSIGIEIDRAFNSFYPRTGPIVSRNGQSVAFYPHCRSPAVRRFPCCFKGPAEIPERPHGFPVVTRQETGIQLYSISDITVLPDSAIEAVYLPVSD